MANRVEEIYNKEGKNITELVQEWINENNEFINLKNTEKYNFRRKELC